MVSNYLNADEAEVTANVDARHVLPLSIVMAGQMRTPDHARAFTVGEADVGAGMQIVAVMIGDDGGSYVVLPPEQARAVAACLMQQAEKQEGGRL